MERRSWKESAGKRKALEGWHHVIAPLSFVTPYTQTPTSLHDATFTKDIIIVRSYIHSISDSGYIALFISTKSNQKEIRKICDKKQKKNSIIKPPSQVFKIHNHVPTPIAPRSHPTHPRQEDDSSPSSVDFVSGSPAPPSTVPRQWRLSP